MENPSIHSEMPQGWNTRGPEEEEEIDLVELFYLLWGHIRQIVN